MQDVSFSRIKCLSALGITEWSIFCTSFQQWKNTEHLKEIFSFTPVIAGSNVREVGMADLAAKSSNLTVSQSPPVWKI